MKKYTNAILFWIIQFPLLLSIFLLNYNDLNNLFYSTTFWTVIIIYICIIVLYYLFTRIIKSIKIHKSLEEFAKSSVVFIILLIPGLFVAYWFLHHYQDDSNLLLRVSGRVAFFYLAFSLSISPLITILKWKWTNTLITIRKYSWILSFLFFVKHWVDYLLIEYWFYNMYYQNTTTFLLYFIKNLNTRTDVVLGLMWWTFMTLLWLTSNNFSYMFLGKLWKALHTIVYPTFLVAMVHIAFAWRFDELYAVVFTVVVWLRFYVYLNQNKSVVNSWPTTKYICVVCWYIYDEQIGDPDSGLVAWTKFEDIPDDWQCPICWVTKKDFIPYYDKTQAAIVSEIVSLVYLTKDVIELKIRLNSHLNVLPGQFMKLIFRDFDWDFNRSYSVAKVENNDYMFLVKIGTWRGWRVLKNLKVWDKLWIWWVFGSFVLQNTTYKKVFIATWTGLSPIYNMIINTAEDKELYFWVRSKEDLFYENELWSIKWLRINYFISGDNIDWYNHWRISVENKFENNTEFYICWNPQMVQDTVENLSNMWYKNIYFEKFL